MNNKEIKKEKCTIKKSADKNKDNELNTNEITLNKKEIFVTKKDEDKNEEE